jgi:UDP-N-acetylglucosamine 2-epimerase (non-hydrolysing)
MPEEINRLVTDRIAHLLLTPSADADAYLLAEGVAPGQIVRVGNVMVDTLMRCLPQAQALPRQGPAGAYALVTLHRPSNVDQPEGLARIWAVLRQLALHLPMVFPVHPRTRAQLERIGALAAPVAGLQLSAPLGYMEFLNLQAAATVVVTDSGGIQEETTVLGVPCLTLRPNTERPITVTEGTNTLVGEAPEALLAPVGEVLAGRYKRGRTPELWDGQAGTRVVAALHAHHQA